MEETAARKGKRKADLIKADDEKLHEVSSSSSLALPEAQVPALTRAPSLTRNRSVTFSSPVAIPLHRGVSLAKMKVGSFRLTKKQKTEQEEAEAKAKADEEEKTKKSEANEMVVGDDVKQNGVLVPVETDVIAPCSSVIFTRFIPQVTKTEIKV